MDSAVERHYHEQKPGGRQGKTEGILSAASRSSEPSSRRRPGRPPLGKRQYAVTLLPETMEALDSRAGEMGQTRSDAIAEAIVLYLAATDQQPRPPAPLPRSLAIAGLTIRTANIARYVAAQRLAGRASAIGASDTATAVHCYVQRAVRRAHGAAAVEALNQGTDQIGAIASIVNEYLARLNPTDPKGGT